MPGYDPEQLQAADAAYVAAGATLDQRYTELLEAQNLESVAGQERIKRYREAFADGLIIEKVVHPDQLKYLAGFIYDGESYEPQWHSLDEAHGESLEGVFAADVDVGGWSRLGRVIKDMPTSQADITLQFVVPGLRENAVGDKRLERDEKES